MKWISIEDDDPPVNRVCFLSCGDRIKFGARIVINAEDDPRPEFCGIFGAPIFYKDSRQWFADRRAGCRCRVYRKQTPPRRG